MFLSEVVGASASQIKTHEDSIGYIKYTKDAEFYSF